MIGERAQNVALGDDAGLRGAMMLAADGRLRSDIERRNAPQDHGRDRDAQARVGGDEFRRPVHHVADAMPVRISVDRFQRVAIEPAGRLQRLDPAGAMLLVEFVGQSAARGHRLGQCADAVFAQFRHQRLEHARGGHRVADRGVPVGRGDAKPRRDDFDRIAREIRLDDLRQETRVERARTDKAEAGAFAFAFEDREIETDRVPDDHASVREVPELLPRLGESGASCTRAASMPWIAVAAGGIGSPGWINER